MKTQQLNKNYRDGMRALNQRARILLKKQKIIAALYNPAIILVVLSSLNVITILLVRWNLIFQPSYIDTASSYITYYGLFIALCINTYFNLFFIINFKKINAGYKKRVEQRIKRIYQAKSKAQARLKLLYRLQLSKIKMTKTDDDTTKI